MFTRLHSSQAKNFVSLSPGKLGELSRKVSSRLAARYLNSNLKFFLPRNIFISWLCNLQTSSKQSKHNLIIIHRRSWAWSNFYRFNEIIEFRLNSSFAFLIFFYCGVKISIAKVFFLKGHLRERINLIFLLPSPSDKWRKKSKRGRQWNWKIILSNVKIVFRARATSGSAEGFFQEKQKGNSCKLDNLCLNDANINRHQQQLTLKSHMIYFITLFSSPALAHNEKIPENPNDDVVYASWVEGIKVVCLKLSSLCVD